MNNFNLILISSLKNHCKILLAFLLTLIVNTLSFPLNLDIASAQENSQSLNQPSENDRQSEPITTTGTRESSSIFEAIWKLLRAKKEQEPALSSRSNICEVTPGLLGETNLIYSDRPLFLWQGTIPQVDIYLYTPFSLDTEQEVFWSQTVASNNRILYSGEPLQPGQIYDWEIVVDSATNRRRISFQVMEAAERDRISKELEQIESELTISGATSEEVIFAKANYFAEKDLWSDSLQELSFLETASYNAMSPEMRQVAIANNQEMISFICQSEPTK